MAEISKGFRISEKDYKKAIKNGAKSIISPSIRKNVSTAMVAEVAPNVFFLHYLERT